MREIRHGGRTPDVYGLLREAREKLKREDDLLY